jgi:hypothetical protein
VRLYDSPAGTCAGSPGRQPWDDEQEFIRVPSGTARDILGECEYVENVSSRVPQGRSVVAQGASNWGAAIPKG